MVWVTIILIVVMLVGVVGTLQIAQSQSNKQENTGYFQNTGKKWARLTGFYIIGAIIAIILVISLK